MEFDRTAATEDRARRLPWSAKIARSRGTQRDLLDPSNRRPMGRFAGPFPFVPDMPPSVPGVGGRRNIEISTGGLGRGSTKSRQAGFIGMLYRRHFCSGEKRGLCVGKTKRGKGTKIMAVADRHGLPVAIHAASASPHEVTLVQSTVQGRFVADTPERLIGDKAYDSDKLDAQMAQQGIAVIAPHKTNRTRPITQDGRALRRYRKRWKVERLFAWLQHFRRILSRHEYHAANFLGCVQLGCLAILMRNYF